MNSNNKKMSILGLIFCMIICTIFTINGVFAALTQNVTTGGTLNVKSYGHVDAEIKFEIAEVNFVKQIHISETEGTQTYTIEGFEEAFTSAFSGNVATDQNDGRIDVKDTATVKITITNTSMDYALADCVITINGTNLVNMKEVAVSGNTTGSNIAVNGGSIEATYVIKVEDARISAQGTYTWNIALTASNEVSNTTSSDVSGTK